MATTAYDTDTTTRYGSTRINERTRDDHRNDGQLMMLDILGAVAGAAMLLLPLTAAATGF